MTEKEKNSWTAKLKKRFRGTIAWKKFRERMIKESNYTCSLCNVSYVGKRKKLLNVHHLYEEKYDNLIPENFVVLCSSCHFMIEDQIAKYLKGEFHPKLYKEWYRLLDKCGLLTKETKEKINKKI